jgi:hypothetical protein
MSMLSKQVKSQHMENASEALKCSNRAAIGGLGRALLVSVSLVVSASLAGCADENAAGGAKYAYASGCQKCGSPWKAAGGNDGKSDRYAVGQLNTVQSAETAQVAQTAATGP